MEIKAEIIKGDAEGKKDEPKVTGNGLWNDIPGTEGLYQKIPDCLNAEIFSAVPLVGKETEKHGIID